MSKHKQLEATEETAVATQQPAGELAQAGVSFDDFAADAGEGSKDIGVRDIAIPFFSIIQSNSPQLTEGDPKFMDGARPGMIFNNVTGEVIPGKVGIPVLRAAYQKEIVEWKPRNSGGGLAGRHSITSDIMSKSHLNEQNKPTLPNGNTLEETAAHFIVVPGPGGRADWAQIPMKSTQLKYSNRWNSALASQTAEKDGKTISLPHYAVIYRLKTMPDKNAKGNFYSWDIQKEGPVEDIRHYNAAKSYRAAVTSGALKAVVGEREDAPAGRHTDADDDGVPF